MLSALSSWHSKMDWWIEIATKWPTFCRRQNQMHFVNAFEFKWIVFLTIIYWNIRQYCFRWFVFQQVTINHMNDIIISWHISDALRWRHQMESFSALLALYAGNSPVIPAQRPVTRSFDVFFDLGPIKWSIKTILRLVIWDAIMTSL